jgi:hypothetical protein
MRQATNSISASTLAALQSATAAQLTRWVTIRRATGTNDGAGGVGRSMADAATVAASITKQTRMAESVQGGGLKPVSWWKLLVPLYTDLRPDDQVTLLGSFSVSLGKPAGGTFTLTFGAQTTPGQAYGATAATVQAALEALTSIGTGNVAVAGASGGPYCVALKGTLAGSSGLLTGSGASLTGSGAAFGITQPIFEVVGTDEGLSEATVLTATLVKLKA